VNGKVVFGALGFLAACSSPPEEGATSSKTTEPEAPPILVIPGSFALGCGTVTVTR
jgi:hypothetical protein